MVTNRRRRNGNVFGAVSDPVRRRILDVLRAGELPAGEVARQFDVSRPAVSRHLRVLKDAGLIREFRQAQSRLYSLNPAPLVELDAWLAHYRRFWSARRHGLEPIVEAEHLGNLDSFPTEKPTP